MKRVFLLLLIVLITSCKRSIIINQKSRLEYVDLTLPKIVDLKKLIEWETQDSLSFVNDLVYLKKEAIATYRFQKNYYFMAGDRVEDSQDSMEQIYETNPTRCL